MHFYFKLKSFPLELLVESSTPPTKSLLIWQLDTVLILIAEQGCNIYLRNYKGRLNTLSISFLSCFSAFKAFLLSVSFALIAACLAASLAFHVGLAALLARSTHILYSADERLSWPLLSLLSLVILSISKRRKCFSWTVL
jgi:hypothetical protein